MKKANTSVVEQFFIHSVDITNRRVYVGSVDTPHEQEAGVDFQMAERAIKALSVLDVTEGDITIIMNNPGGDWYHGMAIYDAITACRNKVIIQVFGMAMSMGAVILQAADERIMAPHSAFMMHYGYFGMDMNHPKIVEKWVDESKKDNSVMEQIFLERMQEADPSTTLKNVKKLLEFDTILRAEEAIRLGLADSILESK